MIKGTTVIATHATISSIVLPMKYGTTQRATPLHNILILQVFLPYMKKPDPTNPATRLTTMVVMLMLPSKDPTSRTGEGEPAEPDRSFAAISPIPDSTCVLSVMQT